MAPVTRRQSMRLAERTDTENQERSERPAKRDSISSVAMVDGNRGRVAKTTVERRGRVVASRYMSSARSKHAAVVEAVVDRQRKDSLVRPLLLPGAQPRATTATTTTNTTTSTASALRKESLAASRRASTMVVTSTPRSLIQSQREEDKQRTVVPSSGSSSVYSAYLQWQLTEARAQMVFEEAKEAAAEELERLAIEAQVARQELANAQRKYKLMTELDALTRWLAVNRRELAHMGAQVSRVRQPYAALSGGLAHTARAMPICNVHYGDGEALVREMHAFVDSVEEGFGPDQGPGRDAMAVAEKLNRLYKAQRQESELASECARIRESLAHTTALAIGRSIDEQQ
ncbi:hypothetical protein GGI22_002217 [Coemansia erecta]|nr:hypothetical protein GGI22_002217 [Coemansia erecta]